MENYFQHWNLTHHHMNNENYSFALEVTHIIYQINNEYNNDALHFSDGLEIGSWSIHNYNYTKTTNIA